VAHVCAAQDKQLVAIPYCLMVDPVDQMLSIFTDKKNMLPLFERDGECRDSQLPLIPCAY
jgi:hypothetical protein